MARDTDGIIQDKFAASGDVGLGDLIIDDGWPLAYSTPGGKDPQRLQFNQLYRFLFALAKEINQKGPFLEYNATIDYAIGAVILATDGNHYRALAANGPATAVVSPIGNPATWLDDLSLLAPLASPALTGSPTAPTQTVGDNSTKIATTAYADSSSIGVGAVGQPELKTAQGEVSTTNTSLTNLTLPGGEYGFYPQVKVASGAYSASIALIGSNTSYVTNIALNTTAGTVSAQQRYVQSSPPYNIGDINWGHFVYQLRNKSTGEVVCSYEAQDPPWAYNGPEWLGKDDPELLALIPHPFPDFGTNLFPESDFEVVLIDIRDFDVNLWLYDNMGLGKTVLSDLKEFAVVGEIRTRQQMGIPEIRGFTDKVKFRARN